MIALPPELDLTAQEAAAESKRARQDNAESNQGEILLGYINQIRAANELGETSITTTCMTHELNWLAHELQARGFEVESEVHLMHGQLTVHWPDAAEKMASASHIAVA